MTKNRFYLIIAAAVTILMNCMTGGMKVWGAEPEPCYSFTTGTARITAGDEWNKAHKVLGKEKASKILSKIVNDSNLVTYIYEDCEVRTMKNQKQQTIIDEITLKENGLTEEGLRIGSSEEDVFRIYPAAFQSYGYYISEKGQTRLVIGFHPEDGRVVSIQYRRKTKTE